MLDLITRDLAAGLAAEAVLLALRDRQTVVLLSSADGRTVVDAAVLIEGRGFVGRALQSGCAVVGPVGVHSDEDLGPLGATGRVTHAIAAPVRPPRGPAGALFAALCGPPADRRSATWLVESYARLAALALHDPAVLQGLLRAAREDALTGCLNVAGLRAELIRETRRAARYGLDLSVCFIDLDKFKRVNDERGHTEGNRVLVEVAVALRACMRDGDILSRFGGDEFVAILPETGSAEAEVLAKRVRDRIAGATALSVDTPLEASIGVAQWAPGMSADGILEAADRALLAAKTNGGGTVLAGEREDLEHAS